MPRKRWRTRISIYDVPISAPPKRAPPPMPDHVKAQTRLEMEAGARRVAEHEAKQALNPRRPVAKSEGRVAEDDLLVRCALVVFDELAVLSPEVQKQLDADLVEAIRFRRAGVKVGKVGVSDRAVADQIFLGDVGQALERVGLPATRWRKRYDDGEGPSDDAPESFYFQLARAIADVSGKPLPQDLKLPGKRAARHQYGAMSPAMKAAQEVELAARRQRLSKLGRRLKAAKKAKGCDVSRP